MCKNDCYPTLASLLVVTLTTGIAHITVIYFAAQMILANELTVGMLFAFMAYQGNFAGRASAFADRVLWLRTIRPLKYSPRKRGALIGLFDFSLHPFAW